MTDEQINIKLPDETVRSLWNFECPECHSDEDLIISATNHAPVDWTRDEDATFGRVTGGTQTLP